MPKTGDNLPRFRSVQLDFAAHIRNPELNPKPADIEARRMQVYVDLFYNNIKNFIDSTFPVARKIVGEPRWRTLAREFVHTHPSQTPYFLEISEEFLSFLQQRGLEDLPPFLLELCHYEWVELALDVAPDPTEAPSYIETARLDATAAAATDEDAAVVISPLVHALVYEYPVHKISEQYQPLQPPEAPTYLLVYRTPALTVRFMESNPLTHHLLDLLQRMAPAQAFAQIGKDLEEAGRPVAEGVLQKQGKEIVNRFREAGIIYTLDKLDE